MTLHLAKGNPAQAQHLLQASHDLMHSLFEPDENHMLNMDALAEPDVHFFTASWSGQVVGCGAFVERDGYGEVKSMFVAEDARGKGVAGAVLNRIEDEARQLGIEILRLETGDKLHAARRLYERYGFVERPAFGDYQACGDASVFMEKHLSKSPD